MEPLDVLEEWLQTRRLVTVIVRETEKHLIIRVLGEDMRFHELIRIFKATTDVGGRIYARLPHTFMLWIPRETVLEKQAKRMM